jgi:hypothetical protein
MTLGGREKRLLLGLAGLLALGLAVRASNRSGGDETPLRPAGAPPPSASASEPAVRDVVVLDLDALVPRENRYPIGRDPFSYEPEPTPPPPPPQPPPPPPTPTPYVTPTPPPPPPPPDHRHLEYLGSFGPENARIAVITSGAELYNVREGAVLEGKFIVQDIGFESVQIGFVGRPDAPPQRLAVGGGGGH